jgi:DNA-binding response OmpR family regulator
LSTDGPAVRILIVDDQISNVRLLELALRRGGYADVASTTDPKQVASLHQECPYDLILLDLQMPELNGFQVMAQLRESEATHPVAILVISADPALMVAALEGGANAFLSKPFRIPDVLERVQILLAKAGLTRIEEPKTLASEEHLAVPELPGVKNVRS